MNETATKEQLEETKRAYMKRINKASYIGDEYTAAKLMTELDAIIRETKIDE